MIRVTKRGRCVGVEREDDVEVGRAELVREVVVELAEHVGIAPRRLGGLAVTAVLVRRRLGLELQEVRLDGPGERELLKIEDGTVTVDVAGVAEAVVVVVRLAAELLPTEAIVSCLATVTTAGDQ